MKFATILFCFTMMLSIHLHCENNEEEKTEEADLWNFSGNFSQVFNQSSFTNWAAGGENTLASTSIVELEATYDNDNISFENQLDLRYGLYKSGEQSLRKNEDRIDFTSKLGRKLVEKLNASAMINYRSQFTKGYDYPNDSVVVSRFMAPGFITVSAGMDYKPWDFLSVYFSPVTDRFTFVLDQKLADQGAFGVEESENLLAELGSMLNLTFSRKFTDNIRVRSRLELFSSYDDFGEIILNWESSANLKITEYITTNVLVHLIQDRNIDEKLQIKQTFGLGLSYSF